MTVHSLDLSAVTGPVATARGLPNPFYVDAALFELEKERVFFRTWAALGFAADVPMPGDARPVDFLGQPLLMLRDRAGRLRVFQNICRHRGMILVAQPCRIERAIRCPYHSWCYELDGRLRTTPHVGGPGTNRHDDIHRDELGLIEVRSHEWLGVVFVNLDGQAPAFEQANAGLMARWAEFDRPLHHGGPESSFTLEVACNWKLAVENYCESYHLPWVHPGLNSYSRLEDHYHIEAPGSFSGQGTLVYRPMQMVDEQTGAGRRFPLFDGLSEQWDEGAEYVALYPNVLLGVHKDHTFAIVLQPAGHERTVERVGIFYTDAAVTEAAVTGAAVTGAASTGAAVTGAAATGDGWADMRAANARMWKDVFVEDVFVVEGMQKGRHARGFDGGRFSPVMDSPTHCFHAWVAGRMAD